jgi:hypothetical protein
VVSYVDTFPTRSHAWFHVGDHLHLHLDVDDHDHDHDHEGYGFCSATFFA